MKPTLLKFMTNTLASVIVGHIILQLSFYLYLNQLLMTDQVLKILLLNSLFTFIAWIVFTPLAYRLVHGRFSPQTPHQEVLS